MSKKLAAVSTRRTDCTHGLQATGNEVRLARVRPSSKSGTRSERPRLSARENEIVQLVIQGLRNKEVAVKLSIEEQTVKNHLRNIFGKLEVFDRRELALYASNRGLVDSAIRAERFSEQQTGL